MTRWKPTAHPGRTLRLPLATAHCCVVFRLGTTMSLASGVPALEAK